MSGENARFRSKRETFRLRMKFVVETDYADSRRFLPIAGHDLGIIELRALPPTTVDRAGEAVRETVEKRYSVSAIMDGIMDG